MLAESFGRLAGLDVDRQHLAVIGAEDQFRRVVALARPIGHAARRGAGVARHLVVPDLLAGGGVQRDDVPIRRAQIHGVAHHQRRGLGGGNPRRIRRLHVIGPGHFQRGDIGRRYLGQKTVALAQDGSGVSQPVLRFLARVEQSLPGDLRRNRTGQQSE